MKLLPLAFIALFSIGCATRSDQATNESRQRYLMGLAWFQNAGEVRALSYQAFNAAKHQVTTELKKRVRGKKKKPAIVFDLDETLLDNSPYQAWAVQNKTGYPKGWKEWIEKAEAKAIPGGIEFAKWGKKKGVELFYISNRKIRGLDATFKNMKALGFPVKKENIMLREKTSSKNERRAVVLKKYRVIAYLGDSLTDFTGDFEKQLTPQRAELVDKMRDEFGRKFIVLPNPVYGDWEGALYQYNWRASETDKVKMLEESLKGF